ncbi:MAG: hemagglutinin repeat-containing protein, partial [Moraxellaceae bacterium]|nr:hemagglutinin repeat-containing protein [Moraxellaceae bacterium]
NVSASHNTSTGGSHQVGNSDIEYGITKIQLLNNDINVENVLKQKIKLDPKIGASIGVQFFDKTTETETTSADGSSLTGGTTKVTADTVKLTGSSVTATDGDVSVDADNITTQASHKTTTMGVNDTTVDLGVDVELGKGGVTDKFTLGVKNKQGITVQQDAVTSAITAKNGKVDLTADSISHEGTNLTAETVNQKADNISQTAATSSKVSDIDETNVDLGLTLSAEFAGGVNGKVDIAGEGGNTKTEETQAVVTQVNGSNINISASDLLSDQGTNYEGAYIDLTATDYENTAAKNTKHETSHKAGAGVNVGVGSSDPESVKIDVGVSGKYQYTDSNSTQAVNSTIDGSTSVKINADNINTQANIQGHDVELNANSINQSQAENTENSVTGGFDADLGVGAVVAVASGGMPIPTLKVKASANGGKTDKVEGVATSINAHNLDINAKKELSLQGTSIEATNANLTGEQVTISGTTSSSKVVGGSAGAKVNLSDDFKNVGLGANFDVKHEVASGGEQANVNANNVNINSKGDVNLTGVVVKGENANVSTDGDLNIEAINNKLQKNNVGAGVDLSASNGKEGFKVGGGSGNLNLDLANNSTHTDGGIYTNTAEVNANNVSLVGANVQADNLTGKVSGTLTTENVVNKVNENSVNLGVNGKAGKVKTDKIVTDGKLGGVDAGLNMDFHHNSKVTNQTSGVTSANNSLEVANTDLDDSKVKEQDLNFGFDFDVSTDVEGMKQQAINNIKKGKTPIVHVDGVTIAPEGVDINPSFDVNGALTDLVQKK